MKEIWKDIKGFKNLYQISNLGNIKSLNAYGHNKKKLLKPFIDKNGYLNIILSKNKKKKYCLVHQLVAKAFIKNPNNYNEVNHLDGNKENNCVDNLEWCDRKHNIRHAFENNLIKTRKKVNQYDLDGNLIATWVSVGMAEKILKFNSSHIYECCNGKIKTCNGYIWRYKND